MFAEVQTGNFFIDAYPQAHGEVQDLKENEADHEGIDQSSRHRDELDAKLPGIAEEQPVGPARVYQFRGEQPGRQRAHHPPDAVHPHHVQGIVIAQFRFGQYRQVANDPGEDADDDGGHGADEAGGGGDGHQPRHRPGSCAQGGGLAPEDPFRPDPGQGGGASSQMGGGEGGAGQGPGRQGAAGVKPEPAEPQQGRPQDGHGQVVGDEGFGAVAIAGVTLAGPHHQGGGQGADAGVDVHHGAAGEIQGPQVLQPAAVTPDPVGDGIVYQGGP